jgi:enterochelin esterase family protein
MFGTGRGEASPAQGPTWEEQNAKVLDDASLRKGLKVFWFGTGKEDFLLKTTQQTVAMLRKHGLDVKYDETEGAHTWLVWRDYLQGFVPQLFR